jgi:hypothetical protein
MTSGILSKVARMSAAEAAWRASVSLRNIVARAGAGVAAPTWDRAQLARVLRPGSPAARAARAADWTAAHTLLADEASAHMPSFLISTTIREAAVKRIVREFPAAAADARARGDRIVAGEFDLLGYRGLRFGDGDRSSLDWHFDPIHNRHAPRDFWSTVPYLNPSCGDHKIIWELNRHQHLLVLGRAYWLTGDTKYRHTAIAHLTDWIASNPPLIGINWASMLELGFRTLSWIWAINFFAEPGKHEEPWLVDTTVALDRQLRHIEQNLSYYFSPNTHLLGEALALYMAGRALPWLASAERYASTGRRVLTDQVTRQIGRDGGHLERSTHYHRYTLDFYILAALVGRITADPAADIFDASVARLAFAARLLADDRGRLPHLGDDDGGMVLPICGRAPDDVQDSLAAASALADRQDLRTGPIPEETFWLMAHPLVQPLLGHAHSATATAFVGSAALPDTGYYVSRSPGGDHLVIDAGEHGYENGGHAHADALSMTLSVRGVPLLIDPGTGSYTAEPDTRDAFRSSMLHNTVTVDGRSQSVPAGPFHWARTARAEAHIWRASDAFDYLEASHNGYAPIEHRRHVLALHGDLVVIADLVSGEGKHDVLAHWHLAPEWTVEPAGRRALLQASGERVQLAVSRGAIDHVRGTGGSRVGWHAPVYGRLEPTSALLVAESGDLPIWIVTVFGLDAANEVLAVEPVPLRAEAGALERGVGVRIVRARSTDLFGVAAQAAAKGRTTAATWRLASYETDARMLFCRASTKASHIALVDGSLVRNADPNAPSIQLPREMPDAYLDLSGADAPIGTAQAGGHVFGGHVQIGGRDLPIAAERRAR